MNFSSQKATLIYNPVAGRGNLADEVQDVAQLWQKKGWHITLCPTQRPNHATELARQAAESGQALVLAAGGDGTINEVANGLVFSETVLAPLPVGTANCLARELNLPLPNRLQPYRLVEASQALLRGNLQKMDVGECSGRYWLLWLGVGLDAFVIQNIEPRPKWFKQFGRAGYAAKSLFYMPQFTGMKTRLTIDGRVIEDDLLWINVSNGRFYGGGEIILNPAGVLNDGLFEIWLFKRGVWPAGQMARYVAEVTLGQHIHDDAVTLLTGRSLTIHTTPAVPFHADAEPIGETPITCTLHPQALHILVPPETPAGLFQ